MKTQIDVTFIGQDYMPLEDTEVIVRSDDEQIVNLVKENKEALIMYFLDNVKEKIIINYSHNAPRKSSEWKSKNISKGYLYKMGVNNASNAEEKTRYGGVVGVIRKMTSLETLYEVIDEKEIKSKSEEIYLKIVLQIQSRMDKKEKDKGRNGHPYFLSTLLFRDKLNLNENTVPGKEEDMYDYLLLYWFKSQLRSSHIKGFYRTYQRFEKNDDHFRGTIDIARHIRLNAGLNNGKIAYSYRENTVNNYLNHMIVASYDYLKNKYYELVEENFDKDLELKSIIERLRQMIGYERYGSYQLIAKNMKPISHPFYTEFEKLRKTCMMILRDEGINFFEGDTEDDIEGILFYLPDFWEDFLENQLEKWIKDLSVQLKSQEAIMVFGSLDANTENNGCLQSTYPDYVFEDEKKRPFMILDAKFRPAWKNTINLKASSPLKKILGDYDKCCRDMTSIGGYATGVIFPVEGDEKIEKRELLHCLSDKNKSCRFYTIPVSVPYSPEDSYTEWREKFNRSLNQSGEWIEQAIKTEYDFSHYANDGDPRISELNNKRTEFDKIWFEEKSESAYS